MTSKAVDRWYREMPREEEMLPKDKYTIFDRKEKSYRKGIHSMTISIPDYGRNTDISQNYPNGPASVNVSILPASELPQCSHNDLPAPPSLATSAISPPENLVAHGEQSEIVNVSAVCWHKASVICLEASSSIARSHITQILVLC
jgi:hypothetical protein